MKKMVRCPQCQAEYDVTKYGEKKLAVKCPRCQSKFVINPSSEQQDSQSQTSILQAMDRPSQPVTQQDDTRLAESRKQFYKDLSGDDQDRQETPEGDERPVVEEQVSVPQDEAQHGGENAVPEELSKAEASSAEDSTVQEPVEEYAEPASEDTERMPYNRAVAMKLADMPGVNRPNLSRFSGRVKYSYADVMSTEFAFDKTEFNRPSVIRKVIWLIVLLFIILSALFVLANHFFLKKYYSDSVTGDVSGKTGSATDIGQAGDGLQQPVTPPAAPAEPAKDQQAFVPKAEPPKDARPVEPAPASPPPHRGESSVAMPAPRRDAPPQSRTWLTKESEHFIVTTDCGQETLDKLASQLESIYKTYCETFAFNGPLDKKRTVKVFSTRETYQAYVQNQYSGGFYNEFTDELSTFYRDDILETLYHECTHMIFDIMIPSYEKGGMPSWINEGMAGYFGSVDETGTEAVTGKISTQYLRTAKHSIQGGTCAGLQLFFFFPRERFMNAADPEGSKRMYAQAWSLCYFLMKTDNGNYNRIISGYIAEMKSGKGWMDAHQTVFEGIDVQALENDWKKFILELAE